MNESSLSRRFVTTLYVMLLLSPIIIAVYFLVSPTVALVSAGGHFWRVHSQVVCGSKFAAIPSAV